MSKVTLVTIGQFVKQNAPISSICLPKETDVKAVRPEKHELPICLQFSVKDRVVKVPFVAKSVESTSVKISATVKFVKLGSVI